MRSSISAIGLDFGFTLVRSVRAPLGCLHAAIKTGGVVLEPPALATVRPNDAAVRAELAAARNARDWNEALLAWYGDWAVACGLPAGCAEAAAVAAAAAYQSTSNWVACDGAGELLCTCASQNVPVGILSTWGPGLAALIDALGWRDHVRVAIASSERGVAKPSPEAFGLLCAELGRTPSEVLFAGDDPCADYDGARANGLQAILIGATVSTARRTVVSLYRLAELIRESPTAAG